MSTFSSPGNEGNSLADKVRAVAEPLCFSENFELVHVACVYSKKETLIRL